MRARAAAGAILLALVAAGALAQTPQRGPASSTLNYVPGVGDMMNLLVQPRHAKLGLAFRARNWPLTAYAFRELRQALHTVETVQPKFRNLTVAELIESTTAEPMRDLDAAIHARDEKAFADAYGRLTDGCNSCHAAVDHGFIVIKAPEASSFSNQDFTGH